MTDDRRLIEDFLPIGPISGRGIARKIPSQGAYLDAALVVGAAAVGGVPGCRVRGPRARFAVPPGKRAGQQEAQPRAG
jgi:hypothetical protein